MKVVSIYYLFLFNHFKFMSYYLYFPNNVKDQIYIESYSKL